MDGTPHKPEPSPDALAPYLAACSEVVEVGARSPEGRERLMALASSLSGDPLPNAFPGLRNVARSLLQAPPDDPTPVARRLQDELEAAALALGPGGIQVLVAEDDLTTGALMEAVLRAPGRKITRVPTARAARERIQAGGVDVALLDLMLPDGDGRDLIRDIRNDPATSDLPVVVFTGLAETQVRLECIALGADEFAQKPIHPDHLSATVARQIARSRGARRTGAVTSSLLERGDLLRRFEALRSSDAPAECPVALIRVEAVRRDPSLLTTPVGDEILRVVGARVAEGLPGGFTAGHWGEGRFVAFAGGADADEVQDALHRIGASLGAERVGEEGISLEVVHAEVWAHPADGLPTAVAVASAVLRQNGTGGPRPRSRRGEDRRRTILLVEDDDVTARLVEHRLGKEGFQVVRFADGQDAFEAMEDLAFDLALLDVKLPGMDGMQLLSALRHGATARPVPVVILSAMSAESDVVEALELGADDYILKPFSPLELVARLKRQLQAAGAPGA